MDEKYYWSPSAKWFKEGNSLQIEIFLYKDIVPDLFPEFYFITQRGTTLDDLYTYFSVLNRNTLKSIIHDFIKKRILINSIQIPKQLFHSQKVLFNNNYSDRIKIDNVELEKFREEQLSRSKKIDKGKKILLRKNVEFPDFIRRRRSYRKFDRNNFIAFETLSNLLSVLKQYNNDGEIRYFYASAGGLYPIDIYLYIKEKRVERMAEGVYYYNPVDNSLNLVNNDVRIEKDSHYFTNQSIFENSAFTIYFIYNADATMPKYDGMGYFYGIIDSGIMISTLTTVAELNNIGLCSIGDMKFKIIEKYFRLSSKQVYLHSIECGLKPLIES